jgi:hypothetical protein
MTKKNYDPRGATDKKLDDLYRIAEAIEEKVEEILDEIKEMAESQLERACRKDEVDYYEGPIGY